MVLAYVQRQASGSFNRGGGTPESAMRLLAAVISSVDGVSARPAPHLALSASRVTGARPERAVVVGDSEADARMARAGGALAGGVLAGVSPAGTLQLAGGRVLEHVAPQLSLAGLASRPNPTGVACCSAVTAPLDRVIEPN